VGQRRKTAAELLQAARQCQSGDTFTAAGQTLTRSAVTRPATGRAITTLGGHAPLVGGTLAPEHVLANPAVAIPVLQSGGRVKSGVRRIGTGRRGSEAALPGGEIRSCREVSGNALGNGVDARPGDLIKHVVPLAVGGEDARLVHDPQMFRQR
jgi:hypothetical protein